MWCVVVGWCRVWVVVGCVVLLLVCAVSCCDASCVMVCVVMCWFVLFCRGPSLSCRVVVSCHDAV